jgi:hypothetical protein
VRGGLLPMGVGTGLSDYTASSRWQGPGGICSRACGPVGHAADGVLSALLFLDELSCMSLGGARQTRRRDDRGAYFNRGAVAARAINGCTSANSLAAKCAGSRQ